MKKPSKTDATAAAIYSVVVLIVIFFVGFLPTDAQSALKSDLFRIGDHGVNWWELSHLAYYTVLGALLPGNFWVAAGVGALFELFESELGESELRGDVVRKVGFNNDSEDYWYGQWQDLCFNSAGYLLGELTSTGSVDLSFP